MLWNITNVMLFHVLIGPPSIVLQLADITIKLLSCCVILLLIMTCFNCNEISCNNSDPKLSKDNIYLCIIKVLCDSSHNLIPVVGTKGKFQPIAGWNDYVKTAHFLLWQSNSKPRFGPICDIMNSSRARFKQCLRFCKSNETRADALTIKPLLNYNVCFWKEVSKKNRIGSNVLASTINGVTSENNITKVWYDHYYKLLKSNGNTSNQPYVESIMTDIVHSQSVFSLFSALDVKHPIDKLKWVKVQVLTRWKVNTSSMHLFVINVV